MKTPPLLILLAVAIVVGAFSLAYPRTLLDSSFPAYIGRTILDGGVPYKEAWDVRAPGIFFAYALEFLLFGKSAVALRVFDLLWQLGTSFVLFSVATRVFGRREVGLIAGTSYLLLYYSLHYWSWAEPDGFLSLPLALGFLFLLDGLEGERILPWALAALWVGVTAIFKLPFGLVGLAMLYAATTREQRHTGQLFSRLVALAVGFSVPLLLCGLYFYWKGGLADLLTTQFVFAPEYVARVHTVLTYRDFLNSALRPNLLPLYVMAALGLAPVMMAVTGGEKVRLAERLLVAWFGVAALTFFLHGSYLGYHYLPMIPPLAILSGPSIHSLAAGFRSRPRRVQSLLVVLAVFSLVMPLKRLSEHGAYAWKTVTGQVAKDPWQELGEYIRERTSPRDFIFVWGNAPVVYLYAERQAASRFLCTAYLSVPWRGVEYRRILSEELRSHTPIYIVLAKSGPITPGLPDSLESFQHMGELKRLLETAYQIERETSAYTLYRRSQSIPGAEPVSPHRSARSILNPQPI